MLPDIAKIRWLIKQASPPECWIPGWESTEGEVCRASRSTGQIIADSTYISAVAPAIILAILDRLDILEEVTTAARAMREATEEYIRMCEDDLILAACKHYGRDFQKMRAAADADAPLQCDREIVLAAVQQAGYALQFADPALRADREIVLAAVREDRWALRYVAPELRSDREIVRAAIGV